MIQETVVIRDIKSTAEIHAVEELQKEVWKVPDIEVVPLSQLIAAKNSGGVLIGAFDRGELVGFAYGFVGLERGLTVHHSHMLAVRPEYRSHDLGFRLKAEQREQVMAQGIDVMTWTFDPLQSLNAYFNINKLGVVADRYYVNFYGEDAGSYLHRNGTDRLWVTWLLDNVRVVERLNRLVSEDEPVEIAKLVEVGSDERPRSSDLDRCLSEDRASIEIPADINAMERLDNSLAFEWREATRRAFTAALDAGFIVEEFYRGLRSGHPFGTYVLKRGRI